MMMIWSQSHNNEIVPVRLWLVLEWRCLVASRIQLGSFQEFSVNKQQNSGTLQMSCHKPYERQRDAWEGYKTCDRIFEQLFRLWILINLPSFIIFFILFPSPSSSSSSDFSPLNTFSNLSQSKLVSSVGTNLVMQRTFNWNLSSTVARDNLQPDKIWPGSRKRPDYLWYRWEQYYSLKN